MNEYECAGFHLGGGGGIHTPLLTHYPLILPLNKFLDETLLRVYLCVCLP